MILISPSVQHKEPIQKYISGPVKYQPWLRTVDTVVPQSLDTLNPKP